MTSVSHEALRAWIERFRGVRCKLAHPRQQLTHSSLHGSTHLDRLPIEIESIREHDVANGLVDSLAEVVIRGFQKRDAIRILDRYKDDQVQALHCSAHAGTPGAEVEEVGLLVGEKVGNDIRKDNGRRSGPLHS
jgi:hypothetical protein